MTHTLRFLAVLLAIPAGLIIGAHGVALIDALAAAAMEGQP